jgi:hypothetical protein
MAQDIVPIRLGLTEGDVVTLWAPRWREGGEEWEAFLGHGEHLYVFADAAELAAFVRTADEHDLTDHPAWHLVPELAVDELVPDEAHHYDLVGVPELVAEDPDTWSVGDLADVIGMVRSLADVCDLEAVHDVLGAADGFALLDQGAMVFTGREGERLWTELATVVVERWDEVVDAVDSLVTTPEVDAGALEAARAELAAAEAATVAADEETGATEDAADATAADATDEDDEATDEDSAEAADEASEEPSRPPTFWEEVGIDPIRIVTSDGDYYTLRCYLDDEPLFLGSDGTIEVFRSQRALAKYVASGEDGESGHDLAVVSTWPEVVAKATAGELLVKVEPENSYVLTGLADDLAGGPETVDPNQLELAVELITDGAEWAGDRSVAEALAPSESLGWLVSFVLRPDPTRLAPSAPYNAEVAAWKRLSNDFVDRLHVN